MIASLVEQEEKPGAECDGKLELSVVNGKKLYFAITGQSVHTSSCYDGRQGSPSEDSGYESAT